MTRVLVVDDAKFMRVKIREILESANYTVGKRLTGRKPWQYIKIRPDLVTMDITMPVKTVYRRCRIF